MGFCRRGHGISRRGSPACRSSRWASGLGMRLKSPRPSDSVRTASPGVAASVGSAVRTGPSASGYQTVLERGRLGRPWPSLLRPSSGRDHAANGAGDPERKITF
ncbi:hypothetical protein D779_2378 [Imhoffiella purpurea]|uniref:Uncharacterized protein n=1 Tax=Imhoffiella purpurea TaxID=1249627 RepID=W9VC75_9GAMM|nr:hypothetical protein D779_2378 [Imhoffiella purpurea]